MRVDSETVGQIGRGILALLGVERGDGDDDARTLARRLAGYRIFEDDDGRMNRALTDVGGGVLVVSQFTLVASTHKGRRPGFDRAARPDEAERLYEVFSGTLRALDLEVATGRFGATMAVELVNEGPATFLLERRPGGDD